MPTNQEVLDSTDKLMERVKTEGVQPIAADSLNKTQTAFQPPTPQVDNTDYMGQFNSLMSQMQNPPKTEMPDYLKPYLDAPAQEEKASGEVRRLGTELQTINADFVAAREGLHTAGMSKQEELLKTNSLSRTAALRALPISIQLDAASGNLQAAQSKVNKLFEFQVREEERQYSYQKELRDKVWDFATNAQKDKLRQQELKDERAFNLYRDNQAYKEKLTEIAIKNGQSDLVSGIMSAKTGAELASVVGQLTQSGDPLERALKEAQLYKLQRETELIGEPTPAEIKANKAALLEAEASIPVMKDKIDAVDALLGHRGLAASVGPNPFARSAPDFDFFTGVRNEFSGAIKNLLTGLTIEELRAAKARGATFGALSDAELELLASSASAISVWEIKKDGVGTGKWDVSEGAFKKELEFIQSKIRRALVLSEGKVMDSDENQLLDKAFGSSDPSSFYGEQSFNNAGNAKASNTQVKGWSSSSLGQLKTSLIAQESGGNYGSVGLQTSHGKALGKYQIIPKFHFEKIGLNPNSTADQQRFLASRNLQDQLFGKIIDELATKYNNDPRKIAAAYYGGGGGASVVGTKAGNRPQTAGGKKMPSINQYVNSVMGRIT